MRNLQPWANPRRMRTPFGMMGFESGVGGTVRAMPRQEGLPVLRASAGRPPSPGPGLSAVLQSGGKRGKGLDAKVKTRVWECTGQGIQSAVRVCHWLIHPTMSAHSACRGEKSCPVQIFRDEGGRQSISPASFPRNGAVTIKGEAQSLSSPDAGQAPGNSHPAVWAA